MIPQQTYTNMIAPDTKPRELTCAVKNGEPAGRQAASMPSAPLDIETLAPRIDRLRMQAHHLMHGCWCDGAPRAERRAHVPPVPPRRQHAAGGHEPAHPDLRAAAGDAPVDLADRADLGVPA